MSWLERNGYDEAAGSLREGMEETLTVLKLALPALLRIEYLKEENRVLREQLGGRRLRFTDAQRRRLAAKARTLGRDGLKEIADLVTPDTSLRWYKKLIAKK